MFGFGSSTLATLAVIIATPLFMCALLYVLVRLEPPVRRPMWLVGAEHPVATPEPREGTESAA